TAESQVTIKRTKPLYFQESIMTGRRTKPDGLPFRLYMNKGKRIVSFGYKSADGTWTFRIKAPLAIPEKVADARRRAIEQANTLNADFSSVRGTSNLIDRYFKWQEDMRRDDE